MTTPAPRLVADSQRDATDASCADVEPIKRLMLAVLGHAVSDFRTYAAVPTHRGKRLFADVDGWFHSSADGPFDFETICHATGLEPDFIRRGLRSSAGCAPPATVGPAVASGAGVILHQ